MPCRYHWSLSVRCWSHGRWYSASLFQFVLCFAWTLCKSFSPLQHQGQRQFSLDFQWSIGCWTPCRNFALAQVMSSCYHLLFFVGWYSDFEITGDFLVVCVFVDAGCSRACSSCYTCWIQWAFAYRWRARWILRFCCVLIVELVEAPSNCLADIWSLSPSCLTLQRCQYWFRKEERVIVLMKLPLNQVLIIL